MHPTALVSLLLLPTVLGASLLPFGPGAGDVGIDPSDVASEHTLSSGEFVFFGKNYKELHVSTLIIAAYYNGITYASEYHHYY